MPNDRSNLELMLHSRSYPMQYASDFAETSIVAVGDQVPPAAPTSPSATAIGAGIRVTWTLPTTNVDGTTMTDLRWHRIYYHTGSGIDITNPATYTAYKVVGAVDEFTDEPIAAGTARYFVVTALDRTGNESPASSEVNATAGAVTPTTSIPDDATGLVFDDAVSGDGIVLGDGIIGIVFVTPDAAWANFDRYKLEFSVDEGGGFGAWTEIPNVPRTAYIHKSLNTGHQYKYRAYVVATDGTISTTPDVEDNAAAGFTPNGADNDAVIAVLVLAEYIIATNEVRAAHIKAGTITGTEISATATIVAGTGNDIGALDGADGTYRIYAGHATPASAPFRVTKAGAVTCTNLTITGGSINLNGGVFQVDALGQVTCSNIQITGAGSTWGGAVLGAVYIPNLDAGKITTGTLVVGRTQAKCTDALADQTSAHTAANIAGQGDLATEDTVGAADCDVTIISGGKIITGLLSATNIQTGTLTGRNIRTAAAGERVGISATIAGFLGVAHRIGAHDGTRNRMLFGTGGGTWYNTNGLATLVFDSTNGTPPLTLNQLLAAGAIPCLTLNQDDGSEGFIDFLGSDRGVITGATNSTGSVRVELNGAVVRLATYANA